MRFCWKKNQTYFWRMASNKINVDREQMHFLHQKSVNNLIPFHWLMSLAQTKLDNLSYRINWIFSLQEK